jgi:2'-5' RNA ligase
VTTLARGFVALYPPPVVVDALESRLAGAWASCPDLRWSPREQWHVTVRFLGRVPDVEELVGRLAPALGELAPAVVALEGTGAFPTPRRASVLWVGVADGGALAALADVVESACVRAGFVPETRPFHPHVTVARAARPRDLRLLMGEIGPDGVGGPWPTTDVRLMASETGGGAAVHRDVVRFRLGIAG